MAKRKLPADYAVNALASAAVRAKMSYGKFVAGLTNEQRKKILEEYRKAFAGRVRS